MAYVAKKQVPLSVAEKTHPYGWTLAVSAPVSSLPAQEGDKRMGENAEGLWALEQDLAQAVSKRNAVALELLLAPEFSTRSGKKEISRSEWLDLLPNLRTRSLEVEEVSGDQFGEVAVIEATLHWRAQTKSPRHPAHTLTGVYRVTDVWARRDGRWQLCSRASKRLSSQPKRLAVPPALSPARRTGEPAPSAA